MGDVVSLEEVRTRRRAATPIPSFDCAIGRLFDALDHIEALGTKAAHEAVCEGIEMLLTREERTITWKK